MTEDSTHPHALHTLIYIFLSHSNLQAKKINMTVFYFVRITAFVNHFYLFITVHRLFMTSVNYSSATVITLHNLLYKERQTEVCDYNIVARQQADVM